MKSTFLVSIIILSGLFASAQGKVDTSYRPYNEPFFSKKFASVLIGYTGLGYQYGEIGFAVNEHGVSGHHVFAWAMFASTEIYLNQRKFIMAPKIGAWMAN